MATRGTKKERERRVLVYGQLECKHSGRIFVDTKSIRMLRRVTAKCGTYIEVLSAMLETRRAKYR